MKAHSSDADCTLDACAVCIGCGVHHDEPCPRCGQRAFHKVGCLDADPELDCMGCGGIGHNEQFCNGGAEHSEPSKEGGGLRAVLPDLCHHALYEIYLNGQYVESVGNLGANAQRASEFWKRKNRKKVVTIEVSPCRLAGCTWRQQ